MQIKPARSIVLLALAALVLPGLGGRVEAVTQVDPAELTGEMRIWARRQVGGSGEPMRRLVGLWRGLVAERELGVRPERGHTATAAEAYRSRRANCTAFAHLFVALGRDVGLSVDFALLDATLRYREAAGFRVAERHLVAVHVDAEGQTWMFDPERIAQIDPRLFTATSDRAARAIFHSNRGVELLASDPEAAEGALRHAVDLDPELELAWVNLGVALRLAGRPGEAEEAFRRAIGIQPDSVTAWRNLALLLQVRRATSRQRPFADGRRGLPERRLVFAPDARRIGRNPVRRRHSCQ